MLLFAQIYGIGILIYACIGIPIMAFQLKPWEQLGIGGLFFITIFWPLGIWALVGQYLSRNDFP